MFTPIIDTVCSLYFYSLFGAYSGVLYYELYRGVVTAR